MPASPLHGEPPAWGGSRNTGPKPTPLLGEQAWSLHTPAASSKCLYLQPARLLLWIMEKNPPSSSVS